MTRIFQSPWFTILAGSLIYLATTVVLLRPATFAGLVPVHNIMSADDDPSWKFRNPEFDEWVAQIKEEKTSLDQRKQQLQKLATRLAAERTEIYSLTQTVAELQSHFDSDIIRLRKQRMDNAKRQAKMISAMSPDGASALINQMPDKQAVQLLFVMKPDVASAILDTMSKRGGVGAKRAAELTMMLRQVLPPAPTNSFNATSLH